jgi:hypothetical protein
MQSNPELREFYDEKREYIKTREMDRGNHIEMCANTMLKNFVNGIKNSEIYKGYYSFYNLDNGCRMGRMKIDTDRQIEDSTEKIDKKFESNVKEKFGENIKIRIEQPINNTNAKRIYFEINPDPKY